MKRIAIVCTLLLLGSFPLLAADPPAPALPVLKAPPAVCSLGGLQRSGLTPKPMFKSLTVVSPPCRSATACSDGSFIQCEINYYGNCTSSDGCWIRCDGETNPFHFCPGAQSNPACDPIQ